MPTDMNLSQLRIVDPILTKVVQGYQQNEFIGSKLFPPVSVMLSGGKVLEFGKESFMLYNARRAPGSKTKRVQFGYEGKDYSLRQESLEAIVPREYQREASRQPGIDLASRAVNLTMNSLMLSLEVEQAALAQDANNYASTNKITLSGTDKWTHADSKPGVLMRTIFETIRGLTGVYPNTMILAPKDFRALQENVSILDKVKYTSGASVTSQLLANYFDIPNIYIGRGVQSAADGTFSDIWTKSVLAYVPQVPSSQEQPSYGYTYVMEGNPLVETPYYDNTVKSWIYGVTYERQPVVTGIDSGYLITGAS